MPNFQGYSQGIEIVSPKSNQFVEGEITLKWNNSSKGNYYQILVSGDSGFNSIYLDTLTLNFINLKPRRGVSYIRIFERNSLGLTDSSIIQSFYYYLPIFNDSLKYWVHADSGITEINNKVSVWQDLSAFSQLATQSNVFYQPTLIKNKVNGHNILDFDFDVFPDVTAINSKNYYIAALYNFHEVTQRPVRLINSAVSASNWVIAPYNTHIVANGFGFVGNGSPIVKDEFVLNGAYFANDTLQHRINSAVITKINQGKIPGTLSIGTFLNSNRMNGDVAEIVMFEGSIDENEVDSIENYLLDKYAPPVNLEENLIVCKYPFDLKIFKKSYKNYLWNDNTIDTNLIINNDGTYSVTVTDIFGRISSDSITISIDSSYSMSFPEDTTICFGEKLYIYSNNSDFFNYSWSDGKGGKYKEISQPGLYVLTVSDCNNNTYIDSINVSVSNISFELKNDTTICFENSIQLLPDTFHNNVNYNWSTGSMDSIISINSSNNYTLTVSNSFGCVVSDQIMVNVDSTFFDATLGSDTTLCAGNEIGLNVADTGLVYMWSTQSSDSIINVDTSGLYTLFASNNNCSFVDSILINIQGLAPEINFTDSSNCFGDSTYFIPRRIDNQPLGNKITWIFNDTDTVRKKISSYLFQSLGVQKVKLQIESINGCIGEKIKNILINDKPKPDFSEFGFCQNVSTTIYNNSTIQSDSIIQSIWRQFSQQNLIKSDSSFSFNTSFPKDSIYFIQLLTTSSNGCLDSITKRISVNSAPKPAFEFKTPFLRDTTQFINMSSINKGNIDQNIWYLGNLDTIFTVDVKYTFPKLGKVKVELTNISDSSCTAKILDSIQIEPFPSIFECIKPIGNSTVQQKVNFVWNRIDSASYYRIYIYDSSSVNLIKTIFPVFSNNHVDSSLKVGNYTWRVSAYQNSSEFISTKINKFSVFNPLEVIGLEYWFNGSSALVDSINRVFGWKNLANSDTIFQNFSNLQPLFMDSLLNGYSGLKFDSTRKTFFNAIKIDTTNYSVSIAYNSSTLLPRQSKLLTTAPGQIRWYLGPYNRHNFFNNNSFIGAGKAIESQRYVVNSAFGDGLMLKHFVNDSLLSSNSYSNVPGQLSIGSSTIEYYLGNILELIIYKSNADSLIRKSTDIFIMDKYAPLNPLGPDIQTCNFPVKLSIDTNVYKNIRWNTGEQGHEILVDSAGMYIVEIEDVFERKYLDSIIISLDKFNTVLSMDYDTLNLCQGEIIDLSINGTPNYSYKWNTGDSTQKITVNNTGIYKVEVINCEATKFVDSVFIRFNKPLFSLGNDTTICHNQQLLLTPDSNFSSVSYNWSTNENTKFIVADSDNTYSLSIIDQFGCIFKDTINISIDSSLFGLTLGADTILCKGNEIGLLNPNVSIINYLWSTGDQSPTTVVDTIGNYSVLISSNRCSINDTIGVQIQGDAPIANFSSLFFCFNDSTEFIDNSTPPLGDQISRWSWRFGEGSFSSQQNPKKQYSSVAPYIVTLEVETNRGCIDTVQKQIIINPLPVANFRFQTFVPCSKNPIYHEDSSRVSTGTINSYLWNFDDLNSNSNTSATRNTLHTFDTTGTYDVSLKVVSNLGCTDSVQNSIFINATPNVNFGASGFCIADSTALIDRSVLASGAILDYLWAIDTNLQTSSNNPTFRLRNPKVKFNSSGDKAVSLRVRSIAGCQSIGRDTISVFNSPIADFIVPTICEGDSFVVLNNSFSIDSIMEFSYSIDSNNFSSSDLNFLIGSSGNKLLKLKVLNNKGCSDSINKILEVNPKPNVDFSILNNGTGIPFNIQLQNSTTNAVEFIWNFGNGDSAFIRTPTYTYQDTGNYSLKLIAASQKGCSDSLIKQVVSLMEFLDAELNAVFLEENLEGELEISARVINSGFNDIYSIKLVADLDNQFQFIKIINDTIYKGESLGVTFDNLFIQENNRKVDFVCVRITSVNNTNDSIPLNNEVCERGFNNELKLIAYPNPVNNQLHLEYVLPRGGNILIQFYDQLGRSVIKPIDLNLEEGLYTNTITTSNLRPGVYSYQFSFNGLFKTGTFIKY